jgi:hypothetical protein
MAIHSSGQFHYSATVHRSPDGVWRGHADTASTPRVHPGLAGDEPHVELSDGMLRLHRTDGDPSESALPSRDPAAAIRQVSLPVGRLDTVLEDGDRLLVSRGPTADVALIVVREAAAARRRVNHRINDRRRRPKASSMAFIDVDDRFVSEDQWRAYIQSLPSTRPDDVYIRFTIEGVHMDLREREYRQHPPWQLYVHKVYRQGVPGETSHVAIVRASLGMSREASIEATEQIASRHVMLHP